MNDPLAEALRQYQIDHADPARVRPFATWDDFARVAREFIAAEIEADMGRANWAKTFRNGMEWAARIAARGLSEAWPA